MRVLISHHDEAVRGVLTQVLTGHHFRVDAAEDCAAALAAGRREIHDLILLDAGEEAEGIDVCSTLKRELTHFVPILVLLPGDADGTRAQALRAGADECVETPVDTDELLVRVRSFLRIKALHDELRIVNRIRGELVDAVSHDLRSPLVGIIGAVQNMLGGYAGPTTPQQREYLMMIGRTASRFHDMMERIQGLARLEAKRVDIRAETLDLEAETLGVAEALATRAAERQVELEVEVAGGTPPAYGEGRLVREALTHLLDNAIKFSLVGSAVRIDIDEVVEKESFFVRWAVRDSGPGIRRSDFERIFHRFEQVHDTQDPTLPQGSGLGLAVAKEIIEAHGGRIELTSELERGSTFTVLLPAAGERVKF